MNKETLFSIIVLFYNNFSYMYDALDSILMQDYENIELIISDDASACFLQDDIRSYIESKEHSNIKNVIFRQNLEHTGTVKNLNEALKVTTGSMVLSLSGDDVLANSKVIRNYADAFSKIASDIVLAQTAMYDFDMEKLHYYFLQPHIINILENEGCGKELFNNLAQFPYLPVNSMAFRKSFFEERGYFDENYCLIEDWPMTLSMAREGVSIQYINQVTIKHRDGGISHGNLSGNHHMLLAYAEDKLHVLEKDILPYKNLLEPSVLQNVKYRYRKERANWDKKKFVREKGVLGLALYCLKYSDIVLPKVFLTMYQRMRNKQYLLWVTSVLLMILCPWICSGISQSFQILFNISAFDIYNQLCSFSYPMLAILFFAGIAIHLLYLVGKLVFAITRFPQLYFSEKLAA